MYTLITVDPDVPYPTHGTEERPLLHGLITNIINGSLSTGKKSIITINITILTREDQFNQFLYAEYDFETVEKSRSQNMKWKLLPYSVVLLTLVYDLFSVFSFFFFVLFCLFVYFNGV